MAVKKKSKAVVTTMTWLELQTKLKKATEKQCTELLESERKGSRRVQYLLRIYGRFNVLRTERERTELLQK